MTEQGYIDATNLGKVRCAVEVLRTLNDQPEGAIPSDEYREVFKLVTGWQERLFAIVKTTEFDAPQEDK